MAKGPKEGQPQRLQALVAELNDIRNKLVETSLLLQDARFALEARHGDAAKQASDKDVWLKRMKEGGDAPRNGPQKRDGRPED